jgi:hypothetical protein
MSLITYLNRQPGEMQSSIRFVIAMMAIIEARIDLAPAKIEAVIDKDHLVRMVDIVTVALDAIYLTGTHSGEVV